MNFIKTYSTYIILITTIVLVLLVAFNFYNYAVSLSDTNLEKQGQIGDSFGVINSIASSIALVVVVISVFIQSRELKAQKDSVELSRKEFVENRITNIVYNQINLSIETINNFTYKVHKNENGVFHGIQALYILNSIITKEFNKYSESKNIYGLRSLVSRFSYENYADLFILISKILNQFNVVNNVLDNSEIDNATKNNYRLVYLENLGDELFYLLNGMKITRIHYNLRESDLKIEINELKWFFDCEAFIQLTDISNRLFLLYKKYSNKYLDETNNEL